jgi:hypothetical protein
MGFPVIKLPLDKGHNRVDAALTSPKDGYTFSFRNVMLSIYPRVTDTGKSLENQ